MTIEGLGKKFQEARLARKLTLDEAARMTKIRPQRLAEIEADDFSQFPSLAYAKGFLLIYGKFLDVDVTPYLDAFEDPESVTVDGYSAHCWNSGCGNRLLWDAIYPQCAAARARERCFERANVAECDSRNRHRRIDTGSSAKYWGCCYECAGRVARSDIGPTRNAKGFGCEFHRVCRAGSAKSEAGYQRRLGGSSRRRHVTWTRLTCTAIRRSKPGRDPTAQENLREGNAWGRRKSRLRTMGLAV
jgi:transcriptional regulator with XRE-family HTH domain